MQATFLTEKHPSRHPLGRSFSLGSVPVDVGLLMPFSVLDLTQSCDQGYFPRRVRGRGEGEPCESIPNSSAVVLSAMAEGFLGDSACLFFCQAGGCSLRTCHSRGLTPSLQGSTASGQKSSTVRGEGTACARGRPVTQSIRKGLGGWSLWQVDIQCLGGGAWDLPPASASPRVNLDCVTPLSESRTPPPPRVPSLPCGCRSRDLGRGFRPPEIEEDGSESC